MRNNYFIVLSIFFICLNNLAFSQAKTKLEPDEFYTLHYYTFEGYASQDKIGELEQAILKIDLVSEAKVKYKSEKNIGQIILVVKEKVITKEDDKIFSPTSIKQVILKSGLVPGEYSTGKYEH